MIFDWYKCCTCDKYALEGHFQSIPFRIGAALKQVKICYLCAAKNIADINSTIRERSTDQSQCGSCHYYYINLDAANTSNCYCDNCYVNNLPRTIKEYSFNVLTILKKGLPTNKLLFGLEFEIETPGVTGASRESLAKKTLEWIGEDFAIAKRDGSVEGFELVTIPADVFVHRDRWSVLKDNNNIPRNLSAWDGKNNGLHIHVSRRPMSSSIIPKLRSFIYNKNNAQYIINIAGRKPNSYTRLEAPVCNSKKGPIAYVEKRYDSEKMSSYHMTTNINKYQAVNIHSSGATLEFRIFKPTFDYDRLMADIEFVYSLCLYLSNAPMGDLKTYEFQSYVNWLLKTNGSDMSHIRNFIKEGKHTFEFGIAPTVKEAKKAKSIDETFIEHVEANLAELGETATERARRLGAENVLGYTVNNTTTWGPYTRIRLTNVG